MNENSEEGPSVLVDKTRQAFSPLKGKRTVSVGRGKGARNIVPAPAGKVNASLAEKKLHVAKTAISFVSGGILKPLSVKSESSTKPVGGKIRKTHVRKAEVPTTSDSCDRYETRYRGRSTSISPATNSEKSSRPGQADSRMVESQLLEHVDETSQSPKPNKFAVDETSKRKSIPQETSNKVEQAQPETSKKKGLVPPETSNKEQTQEDMSTQKESIQPETSKKEVIEPGMSKQKEPNQRDTSKKESAQLETPKEISTPPETSKEEDTSCGDLQRALEDDLCLSDDSEDDLVAKSDDKAPASIFDVPGEVPEPGAHILGNNQGNSPVAETKIKELAVEVESMEVGEQQERVSVKEVKNAECLEHCGVVLESSVHDVSVIGKTPEERIGLLQDENEERSKEASSKEPGTEDPAERGYQTAEKRDANAQQETQVGGSSASVVVSDAEMRTEDGVLLESSLGNAAADVETQISESRTEPVGGASSCVNVEPESEEVVLQESVPQHKRRISSSETEVEEKRRKREEANLPTGCVVLGGNIEPSVSGVADGSSLVSQLESDSLQSSEGAGCVGGEMSTLEVLPDEKVLADMDKKKLESSMASSFGSLSDEEGSAPAENHESVCEETPTMSVTKLLGIFDDPEDSAEDVAEAVAPVQSDSDLSTGVFGSLFDDLPEAASLSTVFEAVLPDLSDNLPNAPAEQVVLEPEVQEPAEKMSSERETAAESTKMVVDGVLALSGASTEEVIASNSNEGTRADPSEMEVEGEALGTSRDQAKIVPSSQQRRTDKSASAATSRRHLPVVALPSGPGRETRPVTRRSAKTAALQETQGRQLRSRGPVKMPEPKRMKYSSKEFISSDESSDSESVKLVIDDSMSGEGAPQVDASPERSSSVEDTPMGNTDVEAQTTKRRRRKSSSSGRCSPVDKAPTAENAELEKVTGTRRRRSACGKSSPLDSSFENSESEKTVGTRSGRKSAPAAEKKYNLRQSASSRASDCESEQVELPSKRRSPRNISEVRSSVTDDEVEAASDAELETAEAMEPGMSFSPRRASKLQKLRRNLSKAHPLLQKPSGRIAVQNEPPPKKSKSDKMEKSEASVATSMQMAKSGRTVCVIAEEPKNSRRPKPKGEIHFSFHLASFFSNFGLDFLSFL